MRNAAIAASRSGGFKGNTPEISPTPYYEPPPTRKPRVVVLKTCVERLLRVHKSNSRTVSDAENLALIGHVSHIIQQL